MGSTSKPKIEVAISNRKKKAQNAWISKTTAIKNLLLKRAPRSAALVTGGDRCSTRPYFDLPLPPDPAEDDAPFPPEFPELPDVPGALDEAPRDPELPGALDDTPFEPEFPGALEDAPFEPELPGALADLPGALDEVPAPVDPDAPKAPPAARPADGVAADRPGAVVGASDDTARPGAAVPERPGAVVGASEETEAPGAVVDTLRPGAVPSPPRDRERVEEAAPAPRVSACPVSDPPEAPPGAMRPPLPRVDPRSDRVA